MPVIPGVVELDIRRVHVVTKNDVSCEIVGIRSHRFWIPRKAILSGRLERVGDRGSVTISERLWNNLVETWHKSRSGKKRRRRRK